MWSNYSLLLLPGSFKSIVVVIVWVSSMDLIDLFENCLYLEYLISYKCMQKNQEITQKKWKYNPTIYATSEHKITLNRLICYQNHIIICSSVFLWYLIEECIIEKWRNQWIQYQSYIKSNCLSLSLYNLTWHI